MVLGKRCDYMYMCSFLNFSPKIHGIVDSNLEHVAHARKKVFSLKKRFALEVLNRSNGRSLLSCTPISDYDEISSFALTAKFIVINIVMFLFHIINNQFSVSHTLFTFNNLTTTATIFLKIHRHYGYTFLNIVYIPMHYTCTANRFCPRSSDPF